VKFHADWCGACKAMGSVFTDLRNKLDGRPVLFVELDLTNATTRHQSMLLASALGIVRALKEHPGTGFILLFDEQRRVKGKLTARQRLKEMAAAICTECE
jgi:thiol-disulfide isomerase/thioredoxin